MNTSDFQPQVHGLVLVHSRKIEVNDLGNMVSLMLMCMPYS